jgi:hypothetical protein
MGSRRAAGILSLVPALRNDRGTCGITAILEIHAIGVMHGGGQPVFRLLGHDFDVIPSEDSAPLPIMRGSSLEK